MEEGKLNQPLWGLVYFWQTLQWLQGAVPSAVVSRALGFCPSFSAPSIGSIPIVGSIQGDGLCRAGQNIGVSLAAATGRCVFRRQIRFGQFSSPHPSTVAGTGFGVHWKRFEDTAALPSIFRAIAIHWWPDASARAVFRRFARNGRKSGR